MEVSGKLLLLQPMPTPTGIVLFPETAPDSILSHP
jgi:hypothetical protein